MTLIDLSYSPALGRPMLTYRASGFRASVRGTFYSSWIASRATGANGVTDTVAPKFALWDAFIYRPEAGRTARIGVQWSFDAR